MSVDFMVEANSTGTFTFTCYGEGYTERTVHGPFASYDDALLAITAHKMTCAECDIYGCYANAVLDVDASINLANRNATMILGVLGIEVDPEYGITGRMDATEFFRRATAAIEVERAIGDRQAVPTVVTKTENGPTWHECGLPEDYVVNTLHELIGIADLARGLGRDVTWG